MYEEAFDNRKITAPIRSSGSPQRPKIVLSSISFRLLLHPFFVIFVLIYPGPILLTRILYCPKSRANDLLNCFKPPLVAIYAGLSGKPNSEFKLVILIIEPPVISYIQQPFL